MYNAPRAATIIANEASTCFSLDRDCFNSIVKDATVKRRERFEQFLNKIELLNELDVYEKGQLSDVLTVVNYAAGDVVIKQVSFFILKYREKLVPNSICLRQVPRMPSRPTPRVRLLALKIRC